MANQLINDLTQAPLPDMLQNLGSAIANTQFAMDSNAMQIAKMMGDREEYGVQFSGEDEKRSLLELGFSPTFYHLSEATIDIRVSLSMSQSKEVSASVGVAAGGGVGFVMFAASVNASYTNKFSYESSGSSAITARFVAIPPPTIFQEVLASRKDIVDPEKDGNE